MLLILALTQALPRITGVRSWMGLALARLTAIRPRSRVRLAIRSIRLLRCVRVMLPRVRPMRLTTRERVAAIAATCKTGAGQRQRAFLIPVRLALSRLPGLIPATIRVPIRATRPVMGHVKPRLPATSSGAICSTVRIGMCGPATGLERERNALAGLSLAARSVRFRLIPAVPVKCSQRGR